MFPQDYDWRYRAISNLLSPRDNPSHYWMAAGGLALTSTRLPDGNVTAEVARQQPDGTWLWIIDRYTIAQERR